MISEKAYITNRFQRDLVSVQAEIAEFTAKMAVDAAYTLTWGISVFQAAAKERVLKQVLESIEQGDDIVSIVTDRVIHKAKYPAQSTLPTSNLIEQYELAALAEVLSAIKDVQEFNKA
jgi:hypothetical protein